MDIGSKIAALRRSVKLTQQELALKLNISQTALSEIESGKTKKIDFLLIDKICKNFEIDLNNFLHNQTVNIVKNAKNCNVDCSDTTLNSSSSKELLENILKRLEIIENKIL